MIDSDRPTRSPEVASIDIDGDILLYDGGRLRLLAGTAAIIWRAIDGGASVRELLDDLAAGDHDVERDVLAFLEGLVAQQLIVASPPDDAARYVAATHTAHVVDETRTLLLNLRTGQRQALSDAGGLVWEWLRRESDQRRIVEGLRRSFADAPASLEADVARLIDELVTAGFLIRHA